MKVQKLAWTDYFRPFTEYRFGSIDNYVLVGAYKNDEYDEYDINLIDDCGAAYIFKNDITKDWNGEKFLSLLFNSVMKSDITSGSTCWTSVPFSGVEDEAKVSLWEIGWKLNCNAG